MDAQEYVAACRQYLGVPFCHQGRSHRGVDCVGLLVCAARDLGIAVTDTLNYLHDPDAGVLYKTLSANGLIAIPRKDIRTGDLMLIRWRTERPRHLAVRTDIGLIHAFSQLRKVVESSIPDDMQIIRGYRWQG